MNARSPSGSAASTTTSLQREPPQRLIPRAWRRGVGRSSWYLADQGVASASNFLLSLMVLRAASVREFGFLALALVLYQVALDVCRAAACWPLMIRGLPGRDAIHGSASVALGVAAATSCLLVPAALLLPGALGHLLLVLAAAMPALLLLDCVRYAAFAARTPWHALEIDSVWLLTQVFMTSCCLRLGAHSPTVMVACWAAGAMAGCWRALRMARPVLSCQRAVRFIANDRRLIGSLVIERVVSTSLSRVIPFVCAAVLSVAAVGNIQAAATVLGPALMVFIGLHPLHQNGARSRVSASISELSRFNFQFGLGLFAFTLLYGFGVMLALKAPAVSLFGPNIGGAWPLLPVTTVWVAACAFLGITTSTLRFVRRPAVLAIFEITAGICHLLATVIGGLVAGATGAVGGAALAVSLSLLFALSMLRGARQASIPGQRSDGD